MKTPTICPEVRDFLKAAQCLHAEQKARPFPYGLTPWPWKRLSIETKKGTYWLHFSPGWICDPASSILVDFPTSDSTKDPL